jgi:hypothetical protein
MKQPQGRRLIQGIATLAAAVFGLHAVAAEPQALPPMPGGWTKVEKLETVKGADGKEHTATCSGLPYTNPEFHFWAKRGNRNNLVVFFEGGGACWDDATCSSPIQIQAGAPQGLYKPQILPIDDPRIQDGIFNLTNRANPVKDWSYVYIPYCTGDLHLGSNTKKYTNAGNPTLPSEFQIEHRGFDNFMVVLEWIRANFRDPQKILVAGSSAGAYGATGNFAWIKESYPKAQADAISDSGQGVTTAAWDMGDPGRDSWNFQLPPWIFDDPAVRSKDVARKVARYYPHSKFSQFTTKLDEVQVLFYSLMGPNGSCRKPAIDWNQQMLKGLRNTAKEGNFRGYLATGPSEVTPGLTYHMIMSFPRFYTEQSAGILFSKWVDGMLNGGLPWSNAACLNCLDPIPCP